MNFGVAESPYHRHSLRSQGDEGVKLKNIPMEHGSMGMAIQNKIDITHLNAIDPIKRHIVIKHALLRLWSQFYVFPVACTVVN